MNEERTQILQMLANGKITVEEAQLLLEALAEGSKAEVEVSLPEDGPFRWAQPPQPPEPPRPPSRVRLPRRRRRREADDLIDKVIEWRAHGVDGHFISQMKEMGFGDVASDDLVEMKIHDVTPAYVRAIREAGFADISAGELVEMRIHDVEPSFIKEMRAATSQDLTVEQLVALRIHDVDADVFAAIVELGALDRDEETIERLKEKAAG